MRAEHCAMSDPYHYDNLFKTVAHQVLTNVLAIAAAHLAVIWLGALAGVGIAHLFGNPRIPAYGILLVFSYLWAMIFSGIGVAWLVVQFGLVVGHMVYADEPRTRWLVPANAILTLTGMLWLLHAFRGGMF